MTHPTNTNHPTKTKKLLSRIQAALRACLVTFLMVPGSGVALFATACADFELSATDTSDASEESAQAPLGGAVAMDEAVATPELSEPVVEPAPPVSSPLPLVAEPAREAEPLTEPAPRAAVNDARLSVVESALARGVSKRSPVGRTHHFEVGEVAWAWVAVANPEEARAVSMRWFRDDALRSRLELKVGKSPRWRTWSRRTLRAGDVGSWRVEVRSDSGELLQTMRFKVTASSDELSAWESGIDGC